MKLSSMMSTVGKTMKNATDVAVDAIGTGLGTLDGHIADTVTEAAEKKLIKKSGDALMNETVQGVRKKVAQKVYNNSARIGKTIGGGVEGLIAGATGGAVIGGIAGGVDDDSTFLEGAAKGALAGGALGGIGGATSAALHNNAGLMTNASNDAFAVAERISKWKVGMGK